MRIARYSLAALLIVLLVVSIGYDRWADRPYIVTALEYELTDGTLGWTVRFTTPGDALGVWRYQAQGASAAIIDCLREVQIGERIPECLESFELPDPPDSN